MRMLYVCVLRAGFGPGLKTSGREFRPLRPLVSGGHSIIFGIKKQQQSRFNNIDMVNIVSNSPTYRDPAYRGSVVSTYMLCV